MTWVSHGFTCWELSGKDRAIKGKNGHFEGLAGAKYWGVREWDTVEEGEDHKAKAQTGRSEYVCIELESLARIMPGYEDLFLCYISQEIIERASLIEWGNKASLKIRRRKKWRKSQCWNPVKGYCSTSGKRGHGFNLTVCKIYWKMGLF